VRAGDRGQQRLPVDQRAQIAQGRHGDARVRFVGELLTGQRIQHPGRHGHLHVIRQRDDDTVRGIATQPTDDRDVLAVEGMVTVVNGR